MFFDLNNIVFSHLKCNKKYARPIRGKSNPYGYRGIRPNGHSHWIVKVKGINHGTYKTKEEAAMAYDKYALEYFGEDAQLNFPEKDYSDYIPSPTFTPNKYRGVTYDKSRTKWCAKLWYNGTHKNIGRYNTEIDAAKAYNAYVIDNNLNLPLNIGI